MKFKRANAVTPRSRPLSRAHDLRTSAGQDDTRFENVVFAGGGNRCFWQAGFWSVAAKALNLSPSRVSAVSAGSAIACTLFSDNFDHGFRHYKKRLPPTTAMSICATCGATNRSSRTARCTVTRSWPASTSRRYGVCAASRRRSAC